MKTRWVRSCFPPRSDVRPYLVLVNHHMVTRSNTRVAPGSVLLDEGSNSGWRENLVGVALVLGAGIGLIVGLILGSAGIVLEGGTGIALGAAVGAAVGLIAGAIARNLYHGRG